MIDSYFVCSVFLHQRDLSVENVEDLGMFDLSAVTQYISTGSAFKFVLFHTVGR